MGNFWAKVDCCEPDECWEWQGVKQNGGYGRVNISATTRYAHRVAWELANNMSADDVTVRHSCDNPGCVNPVHLDAGTDSENLTDAYERGRRAKGEKHHNSKLTEADVVEIRSRYDEGGCSYRSLAEDYPVSSGAIAQIINRETWRDV